jgi:hypothetical protein
MRISHLSCCAPSRSFVSMWAIRLLRQSRHVYYGARAAAQAASGMVSVTLHKGTEI